MGSFEVEVAVSLDAPLALTNTPRAASTTYGAMFLGTGITQILATFVVTTDLKIISMKPLHVNRSSLISSFGTVPLWQIDWHKI
jgi:hypothetical protein